MTSYKIIYNAFLAKIKEDEWGNEQMDYNAIVADWEALLEAAVVWFKLPRISLERVSTEFVADDIAPELGYFVEDLNDQEIQIIATLMKWQWLNRTINSWENVKVMYDERDFSQGNLLNNFVKLLEKTENECYRLQKLYSRSRADGKGGRKPYNFSKLAGRNGIR